MVSPLNLFRWLTSLMLVQALLSQSALGHAGLYNDRLFMVSPAHGNTFCQKGFIALCGGQEMWFEQTTLAKSQQQGQQIILFKREVHKVFNEPENKCFTRAGDFLDCELAEHFESEIDARWMTCEFVEFCDAVMQLKDFPNGNSSDVGNLLSQGTSSPHDDNNGFKDHLSEHLVAYVIAGSLFVVTSVIGVAWYKVRQANLTASQNAKLPH